MIQIHESIFHDTTELKLYSMIQIHKRTNQYFMMPLNLILYMIQILKTTVQYFDTTELILYDSDREENESVFNDTNEYYSPI